ncbi:MAG: hypothetical protein GX856_00395 [Gammaproteobacteria bacterium]|nr:hypothetical protein [Gammaproteobacteria bacterium]
MSGRPATAGPRPRPAAERLRAGIADGVQTVEAFSRRDALDRDWMGWGALRVLSHQRWAPDAHDEGRVANMERLLLVIEGSLDAGCGSLGRFRAEAGDLLWIGTGHGLESRLANASAGRPLRLLECWLQPDRVNAAPAAAVHRCVEGAVGWNLRAAPGGEAGALPLRQAARVATACVEPGATLPLPAADQGRWWLEVVAGGVVARPAGGAARDAHVGWRLGEGDGLAWLAGDPHAPAAVVAAGPLPPRLLLLALPGAAPAG